MTSDVDLADLVGDIEPLLACFIVESRSGALHRQFRRGELSVQPEEVARTVAGLARAQTDLVGHSRPAAMCTLEWPDVVVVVRSVSAEALVVFFFRPEIGLGMARMQITQLLDVLGPLLPALGTHTLRSFPALSSADIPPPPTVEFDDLEADQDASRLEPGLDPESDASPEALGRGRKLLDYLDDHAPDTHAALLRVSLADGPPAVALGDPRPTLRRPVPPGHGVGPSDSRRRTAPRVRTP